MSAEIRDELRCGECGNKTFTLYSVSDGESCRFGGGPMFNGSVVTKCTKCGSESGIGVVASLSVDNEGTLCGGWG